MTHQRARASTHPLHPHRRRVVCLYVRDFSLEGSGNTHTSDEKTDEGANPMKPRRKNRVIPSQYTALHRITALAKSIHVPVRFVPRSELVQLCGERRNQHVVLEVSSFEPVQVPDASFFLREFLMDAAGVASCLPAQTTAATRVLLYLDRIIDPTNVGSMIRTAYFYGVDTIVLSADCAACTPVTSRTSTGFLEHVRVYQATVPTENFLSATRAWVASTAAPAVQLEIIASATLAPHPVKVPKPSPSVGDPSPGANRQLGQITNRGPLYRILLLGNEDTGLSASVVAACTHTVHIHCPRHDRLRQEREVEGASTDGASSHGGASGGTGVHNAVRAGGDGDNNFPKDGDPHVAESRASPVPPTVLELRARNEAKLRRTMPREVTLNVNTACATLLYSLGGGAEVVLEPRRSD